METQLQKGMTGTRETVVTKELTAKSMGSGELDVYATPAMIALMEETAYKSVSEKLKEGFGTVGTLMHVEHISDSPVGMKITCKSELLSVEGRKLVFSVEAFDKKGLIGKGTHERFIIENDRFQDKTDKKLG